jgi:hypothetical protein
MTYNSASDVRQIEIIEAELLVSGPSPFEVEIETDSGRR